MKPLFATIVMFAAFLVCAQEPAPKIITAKTEIAEKIESAGTLKLKASMDKLNGWFFVDFLDAQGQPVTSIRFDPQKMISDGGYDSYEKSIAADEKADFEIRMFNNNFYVLLNGKPVRSFAPKKDGKIARIALRSHSISLSLYSSEWKNDPALQNNLFLKADKGVFGQEVSETVPSGDFELTFRFRPVKTAEKVNHYGVALFPSKTGEAKMQIVFWDKGFQMIHGKKAKWLKDFNPKLDGQWHDFKLKKTDGDFYEIFIDGKPAGSFDTELTEGGRIGFWAYGNWTLDVENVRIAKTKKE